MRRVSWLVTGLSAWGLAGSAAAAPPQPPPSDTIPGDGSGAPQGPSTAPPGARRAPPPMLPAGGSAPAADPIIDQRTSTEDLGAAWGYSSAPAQEPRYVRSATETDLRINPVGYYQGVTVDGANLPPFAPAVMGTAPAVMTWTGFQGERATEGSRLFFQLSSGVEHHLVSQPERITLRLPSTSVNVRNNMRRLDTSFFRTPVTQVVIGRDGADTVISIDLRRPSTPSVELRDAANGYKLLVVQFEAGEADAAAPVETPPSPAPGG